MGERGNSGEGGFRHLSDAAATQQLGRELAGPVLARGPRLLLLRGDLGAGKTCLVQGLAQGLGITEPITSPTFALAQHYRGWHDGLATTLVHLDLYRLEDAEAAEELFAQEEDEALALGAVMAVEWPERMRFTPAPAWQVSLSVVGEARAARVQGPCR
jgi:tRNA threonylcarbamoyladenosine biosynthesis protein TsaE